MSQPPPIPNASPPVWPEAIGAAADAGCPVPILDAMRARDLLGRERYGTPLCRGDGRSHARDCVEELLDGYVYASSAWGPRSIQAREILRVLMIVW